MLVRGMTFTTDYGCVYELEDLVPEIIEARWNPSKKTSWYAIRETFGFSIADLERFVLTDEYRVQVRHTILHYGYKKLLYRFGRGGGTLSKGEFPLKRLSEIFSLPQSVIKEWIDGFPQWYYVKKP